MIIASMAVIASRVNNLGPIFNSLERQTRPPDRVLLYYSSEPWHHDEGIANLVVPKTKLEVEAIRVPNRGSCRKYLFSVERYFHTGASILLLDDDLIWDRQMVKILADHQNRHRRVVGTRGWSQFAISETLEDGKIFQRSGATTVIGKEIDKPQEVVVHSSGWATMFYAKDIDPRLFDRSLQDSVGLGYSDEVFLAAMLPRSKFVIPMPPGFCKRFKMSTALYRAPETKYAKALQAELLGADIIAKARTYLTEGVV